MYKGHKLLVFHEGIEENLMHVCIYVCVFLNSDISK